MTGYGTRTTMDVWGKLWDIATDQPGGPAKIEPHPENEGWVTLIWPDGSRTGLFWHDGRWQFAGSLDSVPCDVAARDF